MRTCYSYINEYELFDNVFESMEDTQRNIICSIYDFNSKKHQRELNAFYNESVVSELELFNEKEGDNLFAKIGNSILELVNKIKNFLNNIKEKLFGKEEQKEVESDVQIVNKIVSQNPQLRNQVCEGIKNEWFTYGDIAKYADDVIALTNMLEKNVIDHQTFKDKLKAKNEAFVKNGKAIIATGAVVGGLLAIVPKVLKHGKECTDSIAKLNKKLSEVGENSQKYYAEDGQNKIQAAFSGLKEALGIATSETKCTTTGFTHIKSVFSRIKNSKVGQLIHVDDTHKDARHVAAATKLDAKNTSIVDKYYDEIEKKLKSGKEHKQRMDEIKARI